MRIVKKPFIPVIVCLLTGFLCFSTTPVYAEHVHKILILHSYHQGFRWTDSVQQGIIQTLTAEQTVQTKKFDIFVEYMDTKRFAPEDVEATLLRLYAAKFSHHQPDIIITSDDNAYQFILKHGSTLFSDTPVIFCGVNNFAETDLSHRKNITGVVEDFSIREALKTIFSVQPFTQRVFVISDSTPTGAININRFNDARSEFTGRAEFILLHGLSTDELRQKLNNPPPNSVILHLSFYRDSKGISYSPDESVELIRSFADIPIYSCWDFVMGPGTLGGNVVSGNNQGQAAAQKAIQIIGGTLVSSIPVQKKSPNTFIFDYTAMQRFGISARMLPEGSIIINKPSSFYYQHRKLVWFVGIVVVVLTILSVSLGLNIRKRLHTEFRLREAERKYRTIFENIPDGYYRTNLKGAIELLNPEAARMLGYSDPHQAVGRSISSIYANSKDRDTFLSLLTKHEHVQGFTTTCKRIDGSLFDVEVNSVLVRDTEGKPVAVEGVVRDITERTRIQDFMVQNEKILSLGGVAAGMAHEINNPLAGILNGLQNMERRLLRDHPANASAAAEAGVDWQNMKVYFEQRGILRIIHGMRESAIRASNIVSSILDFSRKTEGRIEHILPDALVLSALELASNDYNLKKGYDFKRIQIVTHKESNLPTVFCARSEIEQVLFNIFQNAAHAMSEGISYGKGPQLNIRIYTEQEMVTIAVTDNGPGIPEENIKSIFDPFFTTKAPGIGTGLGLSVSYFIITQKHSGRLEVELPEEGGTRFLIKLPRNEKTT